METKPAEYRAPHAFLWILILGATGFAAGFFGPIVFAPSANQGPLVGIFLSGPGGAFLGLVLGVVCYAAKVSAAKQWKILGITAVCLAVGVLFAILPGPEFHGYLEDVTIESCKRPVDAADDAADYWTKQIAQRPAAARQGWQEDSRQMLEADQGVVLGVILVREKMLVEGQKPWNKGQINARDWRDVNAEKSFYAQYAGSSCDAYPAGKRRVLLNDSYIQGFPINLGWPPKKTANYLNLQTVGPVPDNYREFAEH